jgi:hypothetical protein
MSESSIKYEARAAIEAQIEQARAAKPSLAALSPMGLYLGITFAILLGAGINAATDRPDHGIDHGTTAALSQEIPVSGEAQRRAAIPVEPIGGSAGIAHASPVLDFDEVKHRLCVTGEICVDVAPPAKKVDAVAQLTIAP